MNGSLFLQDYNIDFYTEGHKQCRPGWLQLECPFCVGNPGPHLGYCIDANYWCCWRCGYHSHLSVIKELAGVSFAKAKAIYASYEKKHYSPVPHKNNLKAATLIMPGEKMSNTHRQYLKSRKFNPDQLEKEWGLLGTGPTGPYKHRIIIPIRYKGSTVSFQGRDITGQNGSKYKACAENNEVIHHKHIVYGADNALGRGKTAVVVEGVADVWRLGAGAVCTFGIKYTTKQINLLARLFNNVIILFDNEREAQIQAKKLAYALSALETRTLIAQIDNKKDPGEMEDQEASDFMKNIMTNNL